MASASQNSLNPAQQHHATSVKDYINKRGDRKDVCNGCNQQMMGKGTILWNKAFEMRALKSSFLSDDKSNWVMKSRLEV